MAAPKAHPAPAAVAVPHPAVGLLHVMAALRLAAKVPLHRRLVVRMDVEQRQPLVVRAHDEARFDAGDAHRPLGGEHAVIDDVPVEDAVVGALDRAREPLLALAQRLLGALALGDVQRRTCHAVGPAIGVAEALAAAGDPAHHAAGRVDDAVFDVQARGVSPAR